MKWTAMGMVWAAVVALAQHPAEAAGANGETPDAENRILLNDFEGVQEGWRYVGGEEFPGAQGSLAPDTTTAHSGKGSYKLQADFSGGGAYVGVWKDLALLGVSDIQEFRVWVKSSNVARLGVRIADGTDQCHQSSVPISADGEWQEIVLKVRDLVGGEHWGGANDGQWHAPAKGLGLNIGKDSLAEADSAQATLWFDDLSVVVVPLPAATGVQTALSCLLDPPACRPAFGTRVTYRWEAEPMGRDFVVFVHFIGADGKMAFQGDHAPPVPTSGWSGKIEYEETIVVPPTMPNGDYKIVIGLYDPKAAATGWDRQKLKMGDGVLDASDDQEKNQYQVGSLRVDSEAPVPKLPPPTLDLTGYKITFEENFDGPLSVSAWGPCGPGGSRWIAHTPWNGDFGDARFMDPAPGFPFTIENGILRIEARKDKAFADSDTWKREWRAGLLCSADPQGRGFAQKFGYFEMRAKLPKGEGTWPAFWLVGPPGKRPDDQAHIEIDVLEHYGRNPNALHTVVHVWGPGDKHWAEGEVFIVEGMTDGFHTYGAMVEEDFTTFYYDGVELRKGKTLEAAKVPISPLVNLALGSGWPIDKVPNPSIMEVDYVRVHAKK